MFYGLNNQSVVVPESLYPSPLTKYDAPVPGKMTETPGGKSSADKDDNSGKCIIKFQAVINLA